MGKVEMESKKKGLTVKYKKTDSKWDRPSCELRIGSFRAKQEDKFN